MNKFYFKQTILLFSILIGTKSDAQIHQSKKYSSLLRDGLKGEVLLTETSSYTIDTLYKIIRQDSCCINRTEFDKNGNSIRSGRFTINNVYQGGTITTYHSNGLQKEIRYLNKQKTETAREIFFIEKNGNYTGGEAYDEGKLLRAFKISGQNEYGQWTKLNWYSLDGKIYREEVYTYEENRKIKESWKEYKDDPNGLIVQDLSTTYNDRGEMVSQVGIHTFLGTVNQKSNRIFEYDQYGNWIQYIIIDKYEKPIRIVKRRLIYI